MGFRYKYQLYFYTSVKKKKQACSIVEYIYKNRKKNLGFNLTKGYLTPLMQIYKTIFKGIKENLIQ